MASATLAQAKSEKPKQNWILDPYSDLVFVIGAPVLAFVWALLTLRFFGQEIVWNVFIIFNIAHHFPTFIRIYGDKDCFKRFRWSLILGPVIPFTAGLLLSYYTVSNGYPIKTLFVILMVLTLWDPWHFLMQHYGFMRIYDRHNSAPPKLAAWMDYAISLSWFTFIMLATTEWFIDRILYPLFNDNGVRLLLWIEPSIYNAVLNIAFGAAVVASVVYLGYTIWCWRKGFFVSPAKICLLVITFGMMYVTYVPNSFLRASYPEWQFTVGFATLGMVHVTQYLAIVWKYNRGLASKGQERSRSGTFTKVFSQGGLFLGAMYVAVCLIYGALFSNNSPVVPSLQTFGLPAGFLTALSCLIVTVGFTSTFMHYYYDGFIWKFRHKENRENLVVAGEATKGKKTEEESSTDASWWQKVSSDSIWSRFRGDSPLATMTRQACYFGIPIGLIIVTYLFLGQTPRSTQHQAPSIESVVALTQRIEQDANQENLAQLDDALSRVELQIQAEQRMTELCKTNIGMHEEELAFLLYSRARAKVGLAMGASRLEGQPRAPTEAEKQAYVDDVRRAISLLEAQEIPRDLPYLTDEQKRVLQYIDAWKAEVST